MKIALIDCDLNYSLTSSYVHRMPNLALMKLSAHHKKIGDEITLKLDYEDLDKFDKIYMAKVFTSTVSPDIEHPNLIKGGTGFYFDKAPMLPYHIEHMTPDYNLYNDYVKMELDRGLSKRKLTYYLDYYYGFITRGCFRKCAFCVNKRFKKAYKSGDVKEIIDPTIDRKTLFLNDDNFLAYKGWKEELKKLKETGLTIVFKQGLDIRLITEEVAKEFKDVKYGPYYYFAFDHWKDKEIIIRGLNNWTKHISKHRNRFYVFCRMDESGKYDDAFFLQDIKEIFYRLEVLRDYGALPYLMCFEKWRVDNFSDIYMYLRSWINMAGAYKQYTFKEYIYFLMTLNKSFESKTKPLLIYLDVLKKTDKEIYKFFTEFRFHNKERKKVGFSFTFIDNKRVKDSLELTKFKRTEEIPEEWELTKKEIKIIEEAALKETASDPSKKIEEVIDMDIIEEIKEELGGEVKRGRGRPKKIKAIEENETINEENKIVNNNLENIENPLNKVKPVTKVESDKPTTTVTQDIINLFINIDKTNKEIIDLTKKILKF